MHTLNPLEIFLALVCSRLQKRQAQKIVLAKNYIVIIFEVKAAENIAFSSIFFLKIASIC